MELEAAVCSLCRTLTLDTRRRRKLYGSSCSSPRATLERFTRANLGLALDAVVETSNPHAYLCIACFKQLECVRTLEDKLVSTRKELDNLKK